MCSLSLRGPLGPTVQLPVRRPGVGNVLNALAAPFLPVERPGCLRKLSMEWNDLTEIDDGAGEIWPIHHCPPQQRLWWIYAMASYHGRQLTSNLWGTDNPRCVSSWAYLIYQFRQCLSKARLPEDFSVVIPIRWVWEQEVLIPLNDSYSIPFGNKYLEKEMQINC